MVEVETVAQDTFSLTQPTGAVVLLGIIVHVEYAMDRRAIVMGGLRL
jgi:hypothetical protein